MSLSVDNLAEKTFDNFKKLTPALIAISLLTGMLLFLPDRILAEMHLEELPVLWSRIIGTVFLFSVALIITIMVSSVISYISSKSRNKKIRENLKKKVNMLSPRQKSIVLKVLRSEDKSISLDKNSGDTIYLVNNLFLYMPQQVVSLGWDNEMILTYVPHPWLLDLYNEEPELFS